MSNEELLRQLEFERKMHRYWHKVAFVCFQIIGGIVGGAVAFVLIK